MKAQCGRCGLEQELPLVTLETRQPSNGQPLPLGWCVMLAQKHDEQLQQLEALLCPACADSLGTFFTVRTDEEAFSLLREKLAASGMRETTCQRCACWLLTRGDIDMCPPCREAEAHGSPES